MKRHALAAATAAALATLPAAAALDVPGLDKSVDACTDFYGYANRTWLEKTAIPADRARWGTFEIIAERNEKVLKAALDEALAGPLPPAGSVERKVVQYYASGMDEAAIARTGLAPLEPLLARAKAVASPRDVLAAIATLHRHGVGAGFEFDVNPDAKDSTRYLADFVQGGLGMPDRDYYFLEDERSKKLRAGYRAHVQKVFELAGDAPQAASAQADAVLALETEMARASMTATERRDVDKTYNKMPVAKLAEAAPGLPWPEYFAAIGAKDAAEVNVRMPAFFKALGQLATQRPASDWQAYLRFHVLNDAATKLAAPFEAEHFDFYQRQFRGTQAQAPRHRRVLVVMGGVYGELGVGQGIGRLFVEKAFPPEAKARAKVLIDDVKQALRGRLERVEWMSEETRRRSVEKLAAMNVKIGYPDQWRDLSDADVGPYSFVENWMHASAFDLKRQVARIGKPVDRNEWFMAPHIVNAYYNARGNEIVFPAAILQPPYFDMKADDAVNYGGIGMVIGHEITHGFDDRGRRFDKDGNLRDWWTAEDARRYTERAQKVVAQYGAMQGIEGVKPNGQLTLGENLSDVGGIKIAYDALQLALKRTPRGPIDGLTPEQRFFLSYAQAWRQNARVEYERNSLLTGQHSLPRFRVKGPVAHMPEFAKAFSCEPSKALLTESERANIW